MTVATLQPSPSMAYGIDHLSSHERELVEQLRHDVAPIVQVHVCAQTYQDSGRRQEARGRGPRACAWKYPWWTGMYCCDGGGVVGQGPADGNALCSTGVLNQGTDDDRHQRPCAEAR